MPARIPRDAFLGRRRLDGFTLVELLVVIAIIGVLVAVLLPAVQAARESARATQCKNNLHQISLAADLFHDTYKAYPPARYQSRPGDPPSLSCGGKETTWLVRIMPYLEQSVKYDRWDLSQPYANHPDLVRTDSLSTYWCPTRRSQSKSVGQGVLITMGTVYITLPCGCQIAVPGSNSTPIVGAVGDYGGNHGDLSPGSFGLPTDFYYGGNGTGVIISSRAKCEGTTPVDWFDRLAKDQVADGVSNTILTGEMHVTLGKLGQTPNDAFLFNGDNVFGFSRLGGPTVPIVSNVRDDANGLVSWGSWHPGVCHFALCDGSVRAIRNTLDTNVLGRLCNRGDSLPIGDDQ